MTGPGRPVILRTNPSKESAYATLSSRMNSPFLRVLVAVLALALAGAHPALALAGVLKRPSLAFPESVDSAWRESVMKVLDERPAEFAGGTFINGSTILRYQGSVESLNRFLAGLAGCANLLIQVRFASDLDCSWKLEHNAWTNPMDLQLTIHAGAGGLLLDELKIPVIRGGPPSTPPKKSPGE